ncbi:MAG: helix-turn-helix transcriptional regulator [Clostridia bacterium]|nr:helix-turn-helix transcriptional regulator [Clostridia bacterium]
MIYSNDNLSFRILMIDRFFHKEGIFQVKARPYAALSYRVNGTGSFEIEGKSMYSKAGDVLFIPVDTPYKVEYSVGESIVIHFEYCNHVEAESISLSNPSELEVRFHRLMDAWGKHHSVNQAKSMIYDILEKIANDQKMSIHDSSIAGCVRYMEEHFCDPNLNMKAICAASFISASGLQRAFLRYFGISPGQYLIGLRMNRALELLKENTHSVKEIALSCGFTDEKYFSRAFKKKYGYPPSQLRNHMSV